MAVSRPVGEYINHVLYIPSIFFGQYYGSLVTTVPRQFSQKFPLFTYSGIPRASIDRMAKTKRGNNAHSKKPLNDFSMRDIFKKDIDHFVRLGPLRPLLQCK